MAGNYEDAASLLKQGKQAAALKKIDAAIAENPQDARARFLKGLILTEQNQTAAAIEVFTSLTRDYPELPEPYNNLAVLYAAQGQYDRARESLEMAIRTHPSYTVAHENLGDVYAKMASEAYDKALSLDRSNQTAQTKLALIRELFSGAKTLAPEPSQAVESTLEPAATASQSAPKPPSAKPTETHTAAPAAAASPADQTSDVIAAVDSWAKAWSNKDVAGYLAHYSPNFEPADQQSRDEWESTRRSRVGGPKFIKISIVTPKVAFSSDDTATVSFQQGYRSDTIDSVGHKTLKMVKSDGHWLIVQELFAN
jgi:tetratricopeptide (TPR) repeat protein